jgi:hypothetical protein
MNAHKWLLHVLMRTSGSVRSAPGKHSAGKHSAGTVRAWTARRTLILAFVLGSFGAVAAVSSGHGSVGHANAHQPAGNLPRAAAAYSISPGPVSNRPWMY